MPHSNAVFKLNFKPPKTKAVTRRKRDWITRISRRTTISCKRRMVFNIFHAMHWENPEPNVRLVVTNPIKLNKRFFLGNQNLQHTDPEVCLVCQIISIIKRDSEVNLDTETSSVTNGTSDSNICLVDTPCLSSNLSSPRTSDMSESSNKYDTNFLTTVPEVMKASCMAPEKLDAFRQTLKEILEHTQEKWIGETPEGKPGHIKPMLYLRKYRAEPGTHNHRHVYQLAVFSSVPDRRAALVISLYRQDDLKPLMKQSYAFFVDRVAKTLTAFVHKDFDLDSSLRSVPCSAWVENIFNELVNGLKLSKRVKRRYQTDNSDANKKQKAST